MLIRSLVDHHEDHLLTLSPHHRVQQPPQPQKGGNIHHGVVTMETLVDLRDRAKWEKKSMLEIFEDEFDAAVEDDIINYAPDPLPSYQADQGIHFQFKFSSCLKKKPFIDTAGIPPSSFASSSSGPRPQSGAKNHQTSTGSETTQLRPGSDIDTRGYEVGLVGRDHFVAFNKFSLYRPQLLVLTTNAHQRQFQALNRTDLTAGHAVLSAVGANEFMLMYNCGIESSCSRLHKHMHVIPCAGVDRHAERAPGDFRMWPDMADSEIDDLIPFQYRMTRFVMGRLPDGQELTEIYEGHLKALGLRAEEAKDGKVKAHNVVVCHRWIVTIPRRHAALDGLGPNAAGMLGLVWLSTSDGARRWQDKGPMNVLAHCGVLK